MKTKSRLLIPFILVLLQFQAKAQYPDSIAAKIKQVEDKVLPTVYVTGDKPMTLAERMAFYKVKGISVAVIHNYKIEWAKGYGFANDSLKLPVTTHTLFQAGSISKSLNAVGVLKLAQDKKIDLYTDVNNYLTSWKFPYDSVSKGKKITIANLLSHTAGLTVHGFGGYAVGEPIPTLPQVLDGKKPANSPPVRSAFEPGLRFMYSGGGVTISQLIVMDVTHQPYAKYMYANVLKPMGMTESTYEQPPVNVKPEKLAVAYDGDKAIPGLHHIYPEQAAAGLWTNATDLGKYIIETQRAYEGRSAKVLNRQTTQLRLTPYIDKSAAFGCFIFDLSGSKYFFHNGADEGFSAIYYGSIDGGNGVVVMQNANYNQFLDEVVNAVARVYDFKGLDRTRFKKVVTVPTNVLQTYTGEYQLTPDIKITVTLEGNKLYAQPTGQDKLELFAEAQNKFFVKEANAGIEFLTNDKGEVIKGILYEDGPHDIKKIK